MKFSIAIPYYCNEELLKRAIESVLKQTYSNWELIVSYSSHITKDFKDYLADINDSRIVLVQHKNKGISADWNRCVDLATSQYLTLLHADDELEQNYLETIKYLIDRENDASAYFCNVNVIDEVGRKIFSFQDWIKNLIKPKAKEGIVYLNGDVGLAALLKGCFIFCPTVCYKTEILRKYKYSSEWQMVLDLDLYARLMLDEHSIIGSEVKAYRYRRHFNSYSATLTDNQNRFHEEVALYGKLAELAAQKNWPRTLSVAKDKSIIKLHMHYLFFKRLLKLDWDGAKKLLTKF